MEQIIQLMDTLAQAVLFIEDKRKLGMAHTAAFLADDINALFQAVSESIKGLSINCAVPAACEKELFSDDNKLVQWITNVADWHTAVLEKLAPEQGSAHAKRQKLNNLYAVDCKFHALISEISELSADKILYRIKKNFQKLPQPHKDVLVNYMAKYPLWGSLNPSGQDYTLLENKAQSLAEHWQDYLWLYERLGDYRSRHFLLAILNNWYSFNIEDAAKAKESLYNDYFDMDLVRCTADEVIVDLGAYFGDTLESYINTYGISCYKKYYCYEIAQDTFKELSCAAAKARDVECRLKGAGEKQGVMYIASHETDASSNSLIESSEQGGIEVEVVAIDDDIQEEITLIKMDIEGAEQAALRGCARHIKRSKPKLLLSAYHNNEDLWKLARMVDEICEGYTFYLRFSGGNVWPTEYSLIAIYEG